MIETTATLAKDDTLRPESEPLVTHIHSPSQEDREHLPWYNPHGWSLRTKLLVGIFCIAAIIGIIVGAVEGSKTRRYPDYSPLRYRLVDRYNGERFFERFGYFSDEDPTSGFVRCVLPLFSVLVASWWMLMAVGT
jgi:hypothetical protein